MAAQESPPATNKDASAPHEDSERLPAILAREPRHQKGNVSERGECHSKGPFFQGPGGYSNEFGNAAAGQAADTAAFAMGGLGIAGQNAMGQYGVSRNNALANQSVAAANAYGQMGNSYYNTMGSLGISPQYDSGRTERWAQSASGFQNANFIGAAADRLGEGARGL